MLVLTADITPDTKQRALSGGAKDFLTKPFDLSEVLLRIRNMLEIRHLHLQLLKEKHELEARVQERTIELERALGTEREAAERLRALDELKTTFLTAVSHELRTPLTSVLGGAVTLEQSGPVLSGEERRELIHGVVTNAKRLNQILSDLLDVDRLARGITEPRLSPTDIRDLIDRIVVESELQGDHPLDVQADRAMVEVDAPKVERILQSLIINAARHTPDGTPIWVRARAQDGGVLLVVEDAGTGCAGRLANEHLRTVPTRRRSHRPSSGCGGGPFPRVEICSTARRPGLGRGEARRGRLLPRVSSRRLRTGGPIAPGGVAPSSFS